MPKCITGITSKTQLITAITNELTIKVYEKFQGLERSCGQLSLAFFQHYSLAIFLLLSLALSALPQISQAQTTALGTVISNTAKVNYKIPDLNNPGNPKQVFIEATHQLTVAGKTPSSLGAGGGTGTGGAGSDVLQPGLCAAGNPSATISGAGSTTSFQTLPNPITFLGASITTPTPFTFKPQAYLKSGNSLFIRVKDLDKNLSSTQIEHISVVVSTATGDKETVVLSETGVATGEFLGYIPTKRQTPPTPGNCVLEVKGAEKVTITYEDPTDPSDRSTLELLVDPLGTVFDSSNGNPVSGAKVTIIDASTNQPAQVLGDDGVSAYPSTVVSGQTITDASGAQYAYAEGQYRFPLVKPGTYKYLVEPPEQFKYPSTKPTPQIQTDTQNKFTVVNGSKGENFVIDSLYLADIPLDTAATSALAISKTTLKKTAAWGDFIQYIVVVQNTKSSSVGRFMVQDILPKGFRYQKGSLSINSVFGQEPVVELGTDMRVNFPGIEGNGTITIKYVVQITSGAKLGDNYNSATAITAFGGTRSNTAQAKVKVEDDLMATKTIVVGTVYEVESCQDLTKPDYKPKRLEAIKIIFDTGHYVVSDKEGLWHIDSLRPGLHAAKLDSITFLRTHEPLLCEDNNEFAGSADSRFVNATPNGIHRVDFYLKPLPNTKELRAKQLERSQLNGQATQETRLIERTVNAPDSITTRTTNASIVGGENINNPLNNSSTTATTILDKGLAPNTAPAGSTVSTEVNNAVRNPATTPAVPPVDALTVPAGAAPATPTPVPAIPSSSSSSSSSKISTVPNSASNVDPRSPNAIASSTTEAPNTPAKPQAVLAATPAQNEAQAPAITKDTTSLDTTETKDKKLTQSAGTQALSYNEQWIDKAKIEDGFLFPAKGFTPTTLAVGAAITHAPSETLKLFLNDKEVDKVNFDGRRENGEKSVMITYYRGIPIVEGKNKLTAKIYSLDGSKLLRTIDNEFNYSNSIAQAIFVPEKSRLKANGLDSIVVAVRFLDSGGQPIHKGLSGNYQVSGSYTPYIDRSSGLPIAAIDGVRGNQANQFVVGDDGLALIEFNATDIAGEMTLQFPLSNNQRALVRPWIEVSERPWILVGVAQGSITGGKILNMTKDDEKGMELVEQGGKVSFYGKGMISESALLTIAYDTTKKKEKDSFLQQQTLNELYPVYGDATIANQDALSNSKLYIRVDAKRFYAMFGQFNTDFIAQDLTQYSRVLNGLKSEYKSDTWNYKVFAAKTDETLQTQEFNASGFIYFTKTPMEENSETVTVITRDRNFRDVVVERQTLTRFVDYTVNYGTSTITLLKSVGITDASLNPNFLRIDYSTDKGLTSKVGGGRVGYKITPALEVGATLLKEKGLAQSSTLGALDVEYVKDGLTLKGNVGASEKQEGQLQYKNQSGYSFEAQYQNEKWNLRGYTKKVDPYFGMVGTSPLDVGIQKTGLEATYKYSDTLDIQANAVKQHDLLTDLDRNYMEVKALKKFENDSSVFAGVKVVQGNSDVNSLEADSRLISVGGSYRIPDTKLKLIGLVELSDNENINAPTRYKVGAQYDLTENIALAVDNETLKFKDLDNVAQKVNFSRIGILSKFSTGTQLGLSTGMAAGLDNAQFYNIQALQNFDITPSWRIDFGITRQTWSKKIDPKNTPAGSLFLFDNYSGYTFNSTYTKDAYVLQNRVEMKKTNDATSLQVQNNYYQKLNDGWAASIMNTYTKVDSGSETLAGGGATSILRGGWSWRDPNNKYTLLGKVDFISEKLLGQDNKKWIWNNHLNEKNKTSILGNSSEQSYGFSAKHVVQTFDEQEFKGNSYVFSASSTHYLDNKWSVGGVVSLAGTNPGGVRSQGIGGFIGYSIAPNMRVNVGYQKIRNYDKNFNFDESYVNGFFLKLDVKFDEKTFHLNNNKTQAKNVGF